MPQKDDKPVHVEDWKDIELLARIRGGGLEGLVGARMTMSLGIPVKVRVRKKKDV